MVAVVGAGGGVGASTSAALLARRWSAAGPTALVDLDHSGGGVDVLLGLEATPGLRWPDLAAVRGALDAEDLEDVLPTWAGVEVLSCGRVGGPPTDAATQAVLDALVQRCSAVVLDVPAAAVLGAAAGGDAQQWDDVVLLAGQDVRGVAAGLVLREAVAGSGHLVLRRRPTRQVAPLEAAQVLDLPLLGLLPSDRRLPGAVERGFGPVAGRRLRRSVEAVADDLRAAAGPGGRCR